MAEPRIRLGMVGGGPGAFIGAVHRKAAALNGEIELVGGAFSSSAEKSRQQGAELHLDPRRVYGSWEELIDRERALPEGERADFVTIVTPNVSHFAIAKAAFLVVPTGSKYKNTRASFALTTDRITVESLHVEDAGGRPLDVRGSLGTHELRVGDLQIEGTARHFEVMRNEFGTIDVDAAVRLQGRYEAPRVAGDITITSGSLRVDEILTRALFQPYSTEQTAIGDVDASNEPALNCSSSDR